MTIQDDEKFCIPCKKIGVDRKAHRIMPSGGGRCDEHFRDEQGLPQLSPEAVRFIQLCKEREKNPAGSATELEAQYDRVEKPVRKKFDYKAMQVDRDAGMRITDIAKKHGCSIPSVSVNTHSPKERVKIRKANPHKDDALFRRTASNGDFSVMIENLKRKRAVIDDAIEKCENARAALEKL